MKTNFYTTNTGSGEVYFSTVDEIVMTHSRILEENYFEYVNIRFERPNDNGFDFAECTFPLTEFKRTYGFSEDELFELENYVLLNAILIWEGARRASECQKH